MKKPMRSNIVLMLLSFILFLAPLSASAQGASLLTRACRMVKMTGIYKPSAGGDCSGATVECVWGTPSLTAGKNAVQLKGVFGEKTWQLDMVAPMEFYRKDKDVTREGNYSTGVAVMLGDRQHRYIRFCSYFDGNERSAAYLELGSIVTDVVEGKSRMQREGVFVIEKVEFVNVAGSKPRVVVADFNPRKEFYLNALWQFFERMYSSYLPAKSKR